MTAPQSAARPTGLRWLVNENAIMAKRNVLQVLRVPGAIFFILVQPIIFVLLFAYVFGGAIRVPGGGDYKEFLMPGIFAQTVAWIGAASSIGLADDLQKGIMDRFRSLPIRRSSVLLGRSVADLCRICLTVVVMVGVALAIGWRVHDGLARAAAAFGLILLFGYAMAWVGTIIGMSVPNVETANTAGLLWLLPVSFLSNVFVPVTTMPTWMQKVAEWNPLSATVTACRDLFGNPRPEASHGGAFPMHHPVAASIFWSVLIMVIFVPWSSRKYRYASSR